MDWQHITPQQVCVLPKHVAHNTHDRVPTTVITNETRYFTMRWNVFVVIVAIAIVAPTFFFQKVKLILSSSSRCDLVWSNRSYLVRAHTNQSNQVTQFRFDVTVNVSSTINLLLFSNNNNSAAHRNDFMLFFLSSFGFFLFWIFFRFFSRHSLTHAHTYSREYVRTQMCVFRSDREIERGQNWEVRLVYVRVFHRLISLIQTPNRSGCMCSAQCTTMAMCWWSPFRTAFCFYTAISPFVRICVITVCHCVEKSFLA